MSCGHGVQLEDLVPLDDVLAPALVPVVAFRASFRIAREGAYQFVNAVKFDETPGGCFVGLSA